jgi:predicted ATPase/DNA-binding winged helix-turn-helix (wHTH) protein
MAAETPERPRIVRFGMFEADLNTRELRKGGIRIKLQGQPFEVLAMLLERPGQAVQREKLRQKLWTTDTFVDFDAGVNTAINRLREALGDSAENPRFIETLPRRGYRFIAPVEEVNFEPSRLSPIGSNPKADPRGVQAVAVLPPHSNIVGRDREIQEVCALLRSETVRLLTLTGVGGTGKTTLALAAARQVLQDFSAGVFFVGLAEVKQPELVASSIAQAIDVKEGDAKPILQLLKDHLHSRVILLVIDNFEQVLPAASVVAELVAAAPRLKLLVTSRSLLQLTSECEYFVPTLATPKLTAEGSPLDLMRYGAVELFVERARSAVAGFALNQENARTVAEICALLDGLPLAIELAAARMKVLSPREILARLDKRLKLLTGGAKDLPTRLQTMRGTLDWSYELLSDEEKRLFHRLAVFGGSFTLESAEKVAGGETPASDEREELPDVLDTLTGLLNQSLLIAEKRASGVVRFRMLSVVREYALDRLEESGEAEAIRRKHAAHFLALAEEAEPHFQGAQPAPWLHRLDEEYDNIREALHRSIADDFESAIRFGVALRYFWDFMGHLNEGLGILKQLLSRADHIPANRRFKLYSMAGNLAKFQGDHKTAREIYDRGLTEARLAGDSSDVSLLCRGLGGLAFEQRDHATARRFIEQALDAALASKDQFGTARSLNMLGDLGRFQGDYGTARVMLRAALEVCRETDNRYAIANILNNLAAAEYSDGDYEGASAHFIASLKMALESDAKIAGDRIVISYSLDGFAALAVRRGEGKLAATLAGAAERLRESMNFNIEAAERRFRETYVASLHAMLPADQFAAAYDEGRKLDLDESVALALREKLP